MTGQEEGELCRVCDGVVHNSARLHILVLTNTVTWVDREESGLVALLCNNEGYGWFVVFLQLGTSTSDS